MSAAGVRVHDWKADSELGRMGFSLIPTALGNEQSW